MKKLLILGPFPPPYTGNSLPLEKVYDHFNDRDDWQCDVINFNKRSNKSGNWTFQRVLFFLKTWLQFYKTEKRVDVVYLSNAESIAGNLRDLGFYRIRGKRRNRMIVHMLGGANLARLYDPVQRPRLTNLNRKLLSTVGAVIVEGQAQKQTFSAVTHDSKIHVVPNFAESYLYTTQEAIESNFREPSEFRILFLSNMLPGKGHRELLRAYNSLPEQIKSKTCLTFAGQVEDGDFAIVLKAATDANSRIRYLGTVGGEAKAELYAASHVFCLPTYYPYEGQPFTIVEAYAGGCAVITALHSGIPEVFADQVNGIEAPQQDVDGLRDVLSAAFSDLPKLESFALHNFRVARERHSEEVFTARINAIVDEVASGKI